MSSQAFSVLCLTPHSYPISPVLKRNVDDLVTAATEGIRDVDPDGRPIRIFVDTVAILGDLF